MEENSKKVGHRFIVDLEKERQDAMTANQNSSATQDSIALVLTQE